MGYLKWDTYVRILFVGVLAALPTCQGVTNLQDVVAMNFLYAALGSPPLPGWVPAAGDPCGEVWQGVQCVDANITGIVLNDANLGGTLGESLDLFLSILQIQLRNNHIGGSIPSNLPNTLKTFDISSNQFTGSIPEIFSYLVHLTDLVLNKNHLTGTVPDGFQQLTELISLDLSDNNLDGQLPTSMGLLSSLTTLHLQDNHLVGTLDVLQDLPLIDLNIENNLFSGSIPQKLLSIPNFRRAGNSFDNAINTPSPSSPSSPVGAPASEESSLTQPNESASPENSHSSSKRQKNMTTKRIVWAAIAALIIVIVLALVIWLFMSSCRKGMHKSDIFPKRHKMDADDGPKYIPRPSMTLLKPFSRNRNAQKEDVKPPARDENIYGVNDLIPKREAEQGKEFKKFDTVPRPKEVHDIDKAGKDVRILPPPPLPTLLHPFERVVTQPKVPTVTSKRHTTDISNFGKTFSIASLQQYTNSFSQENLIGEGMLGTVYRAELPDGKLLAVKKLDIAASCQQSDEHFLDLVSSLSKLQHVNIVQLVGFCAEHGQRLLVYEYCGNGTVYEAIHIDDEIHKHLSWNARIHLALQAARALEYLHEICQPPVVHKNIKSANFLLDDVLVVRVSDCGLAPLISSNYITQFQGSGYSAPELEMGNYTSQSDVYSFGVVMLELLTGRKSYDRSRPRAEQFLVRWAIPQLHDINALERMVDPSLKESYPSKSLSRLADIISLCVQPEPEFRPQMSEIVEDLVHLVERAS